MRASRPSLHAMFGSAAGGTFMGIESCEDLDRLGQPIALIGAPCAAPYESVGAYCAKGPRAIREGMAAFAANLSHHDFDVGGRIFPGEAGAADCGDLPFDEEDPEGNRNRIRGAVSKILDRKAVPILLGGDDSVPIPMFEAFAGRGNFTVLQVDAHIDWRDEVQGERFGLSSTMRRASEMAQIERIVQVGQRGIGSARRADYDDALAWGVHFVSAREVCAAGVEKALRHVPPSARVIVSIDCDGMDPAIMPGVIGRAPGGLGYWDVIGLLDGVAAKAEIAGVDIVEFMPERDIDGIGALTAGRIVATAMGLIARQQRRNAE